MNYNYAIEKHDCSRIEQLNKLTDKETFWDDVRALTSHITSDHAIHRWQCLAEIRYIELLKMEDN